MFTEIIDLHTHSDCSDGQLSPSELVELAIDREVQVLALTDHDTTAGVMDAQVAARGRIQVIAGIEFSALWSGLNIHIVGLHLDITAPELKQAIDRQCHIRRQRSEIIGERLEKAGISGALSGARHYAKGDSIGRPHFAQYLRDSEYVGSIAEAFKKYLGAGKIGDVKHQWPSIEQVVQWILAAGGAPVLAHPDKYKITRTKLYALLREFVNVGGQAIEVVSGEQDPQVTRKLAKAAADFSLLASCGSDFHSTENAWQSPGKMSPLPRECRPVWQLWPN